MSNDSAEKCVEERKCNNLLSWRELGRDEDAAVHLLDERYRVGHTFIPAGLSPCILARLLALLIRFVAPDVMNVVQAPDLREETGIGFVLVLPKVDCTRPVVAPFDHGAWLEAIRTHLVDVVSLTRLQNWPVAETEQVLQMSCSQEAAAFGCQFDVILKQRGSLFVSASSRLLQYLQHPF